MTRAAASTALMNRELDTLDKQSVRTKRSASDIDSSVTKVGRSADSSGKQIDKLSGRVRILADVAAILGPSLVPIGAVGIPAISGLAAQLGFATLGAGTAVLAFQGMGEALDAMNKAELEPTQENLQAAQVALEKLSPAARDFAQEIRDLVPQVRELRDAASEGFFPGALEGLQSLETALPRIESLISAVARESGAIAADTGASLASDRWAPFLEFLEQEAPSALRDISDIVGNTGHAMAEFWMAFDPLNDDFSSWLVDATESLDEFAGGLDETEGFRNFVEYIDENGPKVAEALGAIANAGVQIVQATAPLGGPVLQGIEAVADVIGNIADSDLGTPIFTAVAALALFDRTLGLFRAGRSGFGGLQTRFTTTRTVASSFGLKIREVGADLRLMGTQAQVAGARTERELLRANAAAGRLKANLVPVGKGAGVLTGLAIAGTGAADSIGLTNTASLALLGSIAGGPGIIAGGLIGAFLDVKDASKGFNEAMRDADNAIDTHNVDEMTRSLRELQRQREDNENKTGFGDFFSDIGKQAVPIFTLQPSIRDQLDAQERSLQFFHEIDSAIQTVAAGEGFMAQGFVATSEGLDVATQSATELKEALQKVDDILAGRADARAFEQSIIDFENRAKKRADLIAQIVEAEKAARGTSTPSPSEQNRLNRLASQSRTADTPAARKKAAEDLAALQATIAGRTHDQQERAAEDVKRLRAEYELYTNTLDISTQAGINNQALLDEFVANVQTFAQSFKDPALKAAFLDNARDQYIKMATTFGDTAEHAEALATQLGLLDTVSGQTKIVIDASGAITVVDVLAEKLRKLQEAANIKLRLTLAQRRDQDGGRDGDLKTPYWSGGFTGPGGKYEPKGVVHGAEVVLPQWVVKRDKEHIVERYGFLPGMNQLRGYADGGFVNPFPQQLQPQVIVQTADAPALDLGQLRMLAASMQPRVGQQVFQVPNFAEYRRIQAEQEWMAASDGVARQ